MKSGEKKSLKNIGRRVRGKISPTLVRFLLAIAPKLPEPALLSFSSWVGLMIYYISGNHRRRSLHNLEIVFGKTKSRSERKALAKAAFRGFAKSGVEALTYSSLPNKVAKDRATIVGKEHLDKALELGKGVIALTAHFGNFMLLHGRLGLEDYAINTVVKAMRDEGVEEILYRLRADRNIKTIYVSPNTQCVRACHGALAANEMLVLLNDQPHKRGVDVDFFGAPTRTAVGPASLALETGAAVVPIFIIRNSDNTHRIEISEAVSLIRTGDRKRDIVENTQAFTKITEAYVLRYPEQWAWNQRRWRNWDG